MESTPVKNGSKRSFASAELTLTLIFLLFIGVFFVLLLVLPKHVGELSGRERTVLADYPVKASDFADGTFARDVIRGDFSENVDDFLESHFPGRQFFLALNSYAKRFTGQNATESITLGRGGRLFTAPAVFDEANITANVDKISAFAAENGLSVCMAIVPSAGSVYAEELPLVHGDYRDDDIIEFVQGSTDAVVPDILSCMRSYHGDANLYYRTDHHWTMSGAYECYLLLCSEMGLDPVDRDEFEANGYEFFGTSYSTSALFLTESDTLEIWEHPDYDNITVTVTSGAEETTHTGMFDYGKLTPKEYDKYAAYLYSNNGITVIDNPNGNGESVMVVKDSFGNSLVPLLALNYSRIIMLDLRYYGANHPLPSELVAEYDVTKLLVVFGVDTITSGYPINYLR